MPCRTRRPASVVGTLAGVVGVLLASACSNDRAEGGASGTAGHGPSSGGSSGASGGTGGRGSSAGGLGGAGTAAGATSGGAAGATGSAGSSAGVGAESGRGPSAGAGPGGTGPSAGAGGAPSAAGTGGAVAAGEGGGSGSGEPEVVEQLRIADVWSGHPVFFALVTHETRQYAAYYDAERNMAVAARTLGETTFESVTLPSVLGWDSHNYVAMAVDGNGQVHVSGNMHANPLVYFRTSAAGDVSTFEKLAMVGTNEGSVTYPVFFVGPTGDLIFEYRDGASGSGNTIFDAYDLGGGKWSRLLNSSLLDGEGQRNAYPEGPVQGPDGAFHLVWVWRDTGDAATNHDLSYARSQDLVHWEAGDGSALTLPVTLAGSDIVDPVPVNGGMINNNTRIGFDLEGRPVVTYHKFDGSSASAKTQLYAARLESGAWVVHRMTDWTERWAFGGANTIVFEIEVNEGVRALPDGRLAQDAYNVNLGGTVTLILDPDTLHAEETIIPALTPYPPELAEPRSSQAGMHVRWASDSGQGPDPKLRYMLRWETLDSNGDQPRSSIPAATPLELYGFSR